MKSPSSSLAASNGDQEASLKLNVVKNIIITPNRDYEESDSDHKSDDSIARVSVKDNQETPAAAATHNYLTLFTQTIATSSLRPIFQFKTEESVKANWGTQASVSSGFQKKSGGFL